MHQALQQDIWVYRHGKDPRFEDLSGKLQDAVFKKRFSFLYDEQLPEESAQLKKKLKVLLAPQSHVVCFLFAPALVMVSIAVLLSKEMYRPWFWQLLSSTRAST